MRLRKFDIENYRSLKKISISEFDSTTIFYGSNNAGKSNILNALELLFKRKQKFQSGGLTEFENFYEGLLPDSKNNFFNNEIDNPIIFKVEIEVEKSELVLDPIIKTLFKSARVVFSFEGNIVFNGDIDGDYSEIKFEEIKADKIIVYSNKDEKISYFSSVKDSIKKQSELNRSVVRLVNIFNDCIYVISSDRDMHDASINDNDTPSVSPKTFKKFLYDLYLSPNRFPLFEEINDVFSKPPFSYGTISFSQEADKKLQLMIKEKDFRLPIKHLGSGVLQSLYIISAIICSKSKIVCIEELEQNLSPYNQYEILKKIQSMIDDPNRTLNQIIVSSHSSVYAKPKLGLIYFLLKENGKTTIKSIIKKPIRATAIVPSLPKALNEHLAPAQVGMSEAEFKQLLSDLKRDHDFW